MKEWNELNQKMVEAQGFNFFRELQEFFRFLVSSAFLNVYNRKVENGILYPNEEDFKRALSLMKSSLKFKFRLLKSSSMAKSISNAKEFIEIMKSDRLSDQTKEIMRSLIEIKGDRIKVRPNIK